MNDDQVGEFRITAEVNTILDHAVGLVQRLGSTVTHFYELGREWHSWPSLRPPLRALCGALIRGPYVDARGPNESVSCAQCDDLGLRRVRWPVAPYHVTHVGAHLRDDLGLDGPEAFRISEFALNTLERRHLFEEMSAKWEMTGVPPDEFVYSESLKARYELMMADNGPIILPD